MLLHQSSELRPKLERSAAGSVFTQMKRDATLKESKNKPSCLNKSSSGCSLIEPFIICCTCPCITSGVIFGVSRQTLLQACFACARSAKNEWEWACLAHRGEVILLLLDLEVLLWHAHSRSAASAFAALNSGCVYSTTKFLNLSLPGL